jgi:hypothetical protein
MRLVGDAVGQRSAVALSVEGRETNVFAFEDLGGASLVIVTRSASGGAAEDLSQGACNRRLLCDVENYWWCHGWLPNELSSFASRDHGSVIFAAEGRHALSAYEFTMVMSNGTILILEYPTFPWGGKTRCAFDCNT